MKTATLVFVVALLLRIAAVVVRGEHLPAGDMNTFGDEHTRVAIKLVQGLGFASPFTDDATPTVYVAPLLPLLTAGIRWLGRSDHVTFYALLSLNLLASALLPVIGGLIAQKLQWPRRVVLLTAFLLCLCPQAFRAAGAITDETLFATGTAAVILAMVHLGQHARLWQLPLIGAAIGVLSLLNPTMLWPLVIAGPLLLVPTDRLARWPVRAAVAVFLLLAGAATALSPWLIRNAQLDRSLAFTITHNRAILLWSAINPIDRERDDAGRITLRPIHPSQSNETLRAADGYMTELEYNRLCASRAAQKFRRGEVYVSEHILTQVSAFATSYHEAIRWQTNPWPPAMVQGGMAILGLFGLIVYTRRNHVPLVIFSVTLIVAYAAPLCLIEGSASARHPLDLLLIIGIAWLAHAALPARTTAASAS